MSEPTFRLPSGDSAALPVPADAFRDRVVRIALSEGIVTQDEIATAWKQFREEAPSGGARFWRFLANHLRTGREAMYALAARIYGFDEVELSVSDIIPFIRDVKEQFSAKDWQTMSRLRIVPVGMEGSQSEPSRLVYACSDPTRMQVNSFLSRLAGRSFVLHYAAASSVDYVIDRVLPVLFSSRQAKAGRIFKPAVRLVPLDPLRDLMEERGGYRKAA